jgi:hypothetical protein
MKGNGSCGNISDHDLRTRCDANKR